MRFLCLLIFLLGCDEEEPKMKASKIFYSFISEPIPWYLANGTIPQSTTYTIYDPLAASSQADSYINLANPGTRNADPISAPSWSSGVGWTFSGSNYLKTGTLAKNEQTILIWVESAAGVYVIGAFTNSGGVREFSIDPTSSTNTVIRRGSTANLFTGVTIGGIVGATKNDCFKNGVNLNASAGTLSSDGIELYIGCQNQNGSPVNYYSGNVLRVAIYDTTLTNEQVETLTQTMFNYQQSPNNSYVNTVMALNPICYYPCNQTRGSILFDISGNNAHGESYNLPVGQSGLYGNSIAGDGNANNSTRTINDWATRTGINLNQFSYACWFRNVANVSNAVRIINAYSNSLNEYYAVELRSGYNIGIYTKENGSLQSTATLVQVLDTDWHHFVAYNDLAGGVMGIYLDGVKYEVAKTTAGFSDTTPDITYPFCFQDLDGNFQHLAFFDHALSQAEVNALQ